jgi:hypothetical protein
LYLTIRKNKWLEPQQHYHRLIFFVHSFSEGNRGFFVVFFFVNIDLWGEHGGTAMAVGDGVFASPTLDVVVFVIAAFEQNGGVRVWSVAGRLASSAHFFSCCT